MKRISSAHRTCDLILGVGDGKVVKSTLVTVYEVELGLHVDAEYSMYFTRGTMSYLHVDASSYISLYFTHRMRVTVFSSYD